MGSPGSGFFLPIDFALIGGQWSYPHSAFSDAHIRPNDGTSGPAAGVRFAAPLHVEPHLVMPVSLALDGARSGKLWLDRGNRGVAGSALLSWRVWMGHVALPEAAYGTSRTPDTSRGGKAELMPNLRGGVGHHAQAQRRNEPLTVILSLSPLSPCSDLIDSLELLSPVGFALSVTVSVPGQLSWLSARSCFRDALHFFLVAGYLEA